MKNVLVNVFLVLIVAFVEFGLIPFSVATAMNYTKETSIQEFRSFFNAIAKVESNSNDNAIGDNGKSIGRYQIGKAYWIDACGTNESLRKGHEWEDIKDPIYAESIMVAYWKRYANQAYLNKDYEVLARIHNGGPRGYKKDSTIPYWNKVKKELQRE